MANVLFTRDTLTNIENLTKNPVTDGQLLFDTSGSGKMYMDVGTQRLEMGGAMTIDSKLNSTSTNPIQNKAVGGVMLSTLDEINVTTSKGFITDALATRALAQKIGTTDISSIGDGTCTGAISALNSRTLKVNSVTVTKTTSEFAETNYYEYRDKIIVGWECNTALLVPQPNKSFRCFGNIQFQQLSPITNTQITFILYYLEIV